jgi:hypothetical protein
MCKMDFLLPNTQMFGFYERRALDRGGCLRPVHLFTNVRPEFRRNERVANPLFDRGGE